MDSRDLTPEQAAKVHGQIRSMFHYVARLQARMEERQFAAGDRLFLEVKAARLALQLLTDDLHRLSYGPAYGGTRQG